MLIAVLIGLLPAVPTLLLAIPASLAVIAVAGLLAGLGAMVFNTLWETTLQQHIPEIARSRVSSYDWFGSLALQAIGFALIGPFATAVGISTALWICGAVELLVVASLLTVSDVRAITASPADVATGAQAAEHEAANEAPQLSGQPQPIKRA
jgi:MFS family permease